jgi:hypothetical protein
LTFTGLHGVISKKMKFFRLKFYRDCYIKLSYVLHDVRCTNRLPVGAHSLA